MGCLYQLTSPSGKSYVGITTKTLPQRMREHEKCARLGLGWGKRKGPQPSMVVHRAMRKYGYETFVAKELVRANDWSYLCDLERKAIVALNTATPNGYNAAEGGEGATMLFLDGDSRAKHMIRSRDGVIRSWQTPEARANHMAAFRGEKFRSAISKAMKARWANPEHRPQLEKSVKTMQDAAYVARKSRRLSIACLTCGVHMEVQPSDANKKYCSVACRAKGQASHQVTLKCQTCQTLFKVRRSAAARGVKYCSWGCRYKRASE